MNTIDDPGIPTPWGIADAATEYGPGLILYATPSHGGFYLSPELWEEAQKAFPGFRPWAGPQWLEEDCDAVIPPLLWPDRFTADAVASAVRFAQECSQANFNPIRAWLASPAGARAREIASAFFAANADNYLPIPVDTLP